tara:strand:+ start:3165 stop:3641 length:477 start_codon:yes stop_codon:yes gene_type:complete
MRLSDNFTLNELTRSSVAKRKGIDNTPDLFHIENLKRVCAEILQPIRDHFGVPFSPSSGYRSVELCEAIGSSSDSQHAKGEAVDFEIPGMDNRDLALWIKDNLHFDQLILEHYDPKDTSAGWIHCSVTEDYNRKECLNYDGKLYSLGIKSDFEEHATF